MRPADTSGPTVIAWSAELVQSSDSSDTERAFVRYQAAAPNRNGRYPGVFALVNGLAWSGCLNAEQERFRRRENA